MSEQDLQTKIIKHLQKQGIMCWKQSCSINGMPDIGGITKSGTYFGIEVKDKGKKPEPLQYYMLDCINHNNGIAFWCDSWEAFLEQENKIRS